MDAKDAAVAQMEMILRIALPNLATQRGERFLEMITRRSIHVDLQTSDDFKITKETITIGAKNASKSDLFRFLNRLLDCVVEHEERKDREAAARLQERIDLAVSALSYLYKKNPELAEQAIALAKEMTK
jgi:hypothetical protein